MTTPPTPAGWYPDPERAGLFRYWDGAVWTEHRSPVQEPPAPEPPAEPAEPHAADHGAPRAPEPESEPTSTDEPDPLPVTEELTTEIPLRKWSFEPPPLEPETGPWAMGITASEPTSTPEPTPASEPTTTPEPITTPEPPPLTELPTTKVPLRDWNAAQTPESAPYADATTPTPPEPPAVEPPAGTEPRTPVDNRKLVMGFGAAVAALLLILVLAAVYAFVIHKPDNTQLSAQAPETSTTTTEEETTTSEEATATEPAPPPGAGATDGPLTFTVTGVDSGTTVTDPTNDLLTKVAQGEFIVVRLTVQNTSPDPGQFLGTLQKLKAAGQVYSIDDEATYYVGGALADIPPGGQVEVGLAYDVPPGTVPETIELHADPISPGVELPVA